MAIAEDATALLQTDSRNGSKLAQSPAISVHSCIKTGKTSHRRNLHSTSFRPSVEVQIIAEDYSFSQEFSIQHGDLVDWDDKPWQLWMRDSQNNWYRRAPQSEQAVSSCDSVDQNQGFFHRFISSVSHTIMVAPRHLAQRICKRAIQNRAQNLQSRDFHCLLSCSTFWE